MQFTKEEREQIRNAIEEKAPKFNRCPLCLNQNWDLQDGFAFPTLQDRTGGQEIGGPGLPSVVIVCDNCGNTHFLNAMVLGLKDLVNRYR